MGAPKSAGAGSPRTARAVAAGVALATFAGWMAGASRAYGYDAAVTMQRFVVVPFRSVLTTQVVWNNHPYFSLVEHLMWRVTGSDDEWVMRIAPAAFGAAATGLLAFVLVPKFGVRAGVLSAAFLATHPLTTHLRDVRGYSLALFAIVVMGVAVLERPRRPLLFGVALGLGLGTHLYVAVPAAALASCIVATGRWNAAWSRAALGGLLLGALPYVTMASHLGRRGREFKAQFPLDAAWELFGGRWYTMGVAVGILWAAARRHTWSRPFGAVLAVLVIGIVGPWLVAPIDLYPRFIYWLVPAMATVIAFAIHRAGTLALVATTALIVAMLVPQLDSWTDDPLPVRSMAAAAGTGDVCLVGFPSEAAQWYLPTARLGSDCERAALLLPGADAAATALARQRWPVTCWERPGAQVRATSSSTCVDL